MIFDCLIANQDRHHENWGLVVKENLKVVLASSFDHASSLGCRVTIDEIQKRLVTKDRNYTVEKFCQKAKSPFYNSKQLSTIGVIEHAVKHNQDAIRFWIEKLNILNSRNLSDIFDKIPKEFQEDEKIYEFMIKIIEINKNRLKKLLLEYKL